MSNPVVTERWAGTFECEGPCRRKRLTASEFSKKAIEKHRQSKDHSLRCKQCVSQAEAAERQQAADRRATQAEMDENRASRERHNETELVECAGSCGRKDLPPSSFNRNQLSKGPGKARCRECVERAVQDESKASEKVQNDKMAEARDALKKAEAKGNVSDIFEASNHLSALEAQLVTGLKPVGPPRGRGGRYRGRGGKVMR